MRHTVDGAPDGYIGVSLSLGSLLLTHPGCMGMCQASASEAVTHPCRHETPHATVQLRYAPVGCRARCTCRENAVEMRVTTLYSTYTVPQCAVVPLQLYSTLQRSTASTASTAIQPLQYTALYTSPLSLLTKPRGPHACMAAGPRAPRSPRRPRARFGVPNWVVVVGSP